ncbi:MAG: hypothetical protein LBR14_00760 [Clostridiales Family XIII bacterium]|jgi:hypothetical protein|nr:hypothetical protein [Clostridiales Family XIII bacterium]
MRYISHRTAANNHCIPHLPSIYPAGESVSRDYTFDSYNARYQASNICIHTSQLPLPKGAIVKVGDIYVASPELTFLQLAEELDIQRLILLGLQMCYHPPGKPEEAVTSKEKIRSFLKKTKKHTGHRKAVRAAKYIENGSWSIMESFTYMFLTLPHLLGGYGLKGATLNHEIPLNAGNRKWFGVNRFFVDLYYKKARLAIEYQSHEYHATASKQGEDMVRASILEKQGIQVMQLSTIQLYNKNLLRDFAFVLAARLGKRIEIRTSQFGAMHEKLHNLLPRREEQTS